MVVVKTNREIARVRKLSQDNELVRRQVRVDTTRGGGAGGTGVEKQLVIYAVEIALLAARPIPGGEGNQVAAVIEVTEKIARRELVSVERCRKAGTILSIGARATSRTRRKQSMR